MLVLAFRTILMLALGPNITRSSRVTYITQPRSFAIDVGMCDQDYDLGFALRRRSQVMGGSTEDDIFEMKR